MPVIRRRINMQRTQPGISSAANCPRFGNGTRCVQGRNDLQIVTVGHNMTHNKQNGMQPVNMAAYHPIFANFFLKKNPVKAAAQSQKKQFSMWEVTPVLQYEGSNRFSAVYFKFYIRNT